MTDEEHNKLVLDVLTCVELAVLMVRDERRIDTCSNATLMNCLAHNIKEVADRRRR